VRPVVRHAAVARHSSCSGSLVAEAEGRTEERLRGGRSEQ
jgi:hypothetical protein